MAMSEYAQALNCLQSFVRNGCKEAVALGQRQLVLKEPQIAAKGRLDKIIITDFTDDFAVFYPDKATPELCPFLCTGNPQKACDAIILTRSGRKNYILICELKSGSRKGISSQFKNSAAIADFLQSLARHHGDLDCSNWERRYIVIGPRSTKKKKTRQTNLIAGTHPARPREITRKNNTSLLVRELCLPLAS